MIGASYTDVHASLPVLHFLAIVSLVAAAIFLANIRYKGWRLPAIAIAVMFLTWAFAGKAYPAIIQSYRVSPNEITAESPYIANNIEATRFAFGLDKMTSTSSPAAGDLTAADIKANESTLESVRIWEPRPALDTYQQIQSIRLYYVFNDVDVDRYTVDGSYRQVLISGRELDQSKLQPQSKTWINLHLTYTHGYGFVLSPGERGGRRRLAGSLGQGHPSADHRPTSRSPARRSTTGNWATTTSSSRARARSSTTPRATRTCPPRTKVTAACPSAAGSGGSPSASASGRPRSCSRAPSPRIRGSCICGPSRSGCRRWRRS